ncbi:MAG: hypothetical protein JJT88_15585 [Gammaproteobacteria bacterium]|nr:hypothetical protein [Gammaproteobacteria bacterium]
MSQQRSLRLRIPARSDSAPACCNGDAAQLAAWIDGLPLQDAEHCGRELQVALAELNRFATEPDTRFALLELLRPTVHYTCSSLSRGWLHQTLVLDRAQQELAGLAQSLQNQLATGYKVVIVDCLRSGADFDQPLVERSPGALIAQATHRALTDQSRTLLRSLQLYTPAPARLWHDCHQLYNLAASYGFLDHPVTDPENQLRPTTAVADAYLRLLLLGSSRPNMLRQSSIGALFQVLEDWSCHARLRPRTQGSEPFLLVDISGDNAPVSTRSYREQIPENAELQELDASTLVQLLNAQLAGSGSADILLPDFLTPDLIRHVVQAWGVLSKRAFRRVSASGQLDICVGLATLHDLSTSQRARLRQHRVLLADTSPGGYGIRWDGEIPVSLQTGELVGVRETADHHWAIAVVRWLQRRDNTTALGVELLGPRALPASARPLRARGSVEEASAALLLPELKAINQPAMLITPPDRFTVGEKVLLEQGGRELRALLVRSNHASVSFCEFEFQELDAPAHSPWTGIEVEHLSEEDFWESVDYHTDTAPRGR